MVKTTTTNRRTPDPKDERREGYKLAITMLRDLEASTDLCDLCALDEFVTRRATPQDNIVLRYLEQCRARSPDTAAGFCAVLSDMVAGCSEGLIPDSGNYQKGLKILVPRKRESKENKRLRTWKSVSRITGKDYGPMPADWMK